MTEQSILLTIGSLPITAYGICIAIAAGAGLLWMQRNVRRMKLPADTVVRFGLWAIPLGLLFGRGLFVALRWSLVVNVLGWQHIIMVWDGGFALFGVLPGCMIAAVCCAKRMQINAAGIMDAAAPGAALALAIARFAEYFTLQGVGRPVMTTGLQWFPLAIQNFYGEWVTPVFLWEGLSALAIALVTARAFDRGYRKPFDTTSVFLLWLGVTQVLLESLRADDILRLGLVKASQLTAMACVLAVGIRWAVLTVKAGKAIRKIYAYLAGLIAGVGICTYIEFALDKTTIPNAVLYLVMAATLAGMAALAYRLRGMTAETKGETLETST